VVMSPDYPPQHGALPRSRVVELIERGQEDILRQLRDEGIPETEALAVIKRFSAFAIQVLRELDDLYREFEALLASDPVRSQAHQEWLDTKAGGLLLTIEAFIADLVAEAINKAKADYRAKISKPRAVITTPPQRPSRWEEVADQIAQAVLIPMLLLIVIGSLGLGWFLVWQWASQSTTWAVIATGIAAFVVVLFQKPGLVFILIAGAVCFLLLLLGGA
jgi:hypothetical protein